MKPNEDAYPNELTMYNDEEVITEGYTGSTIKLGTKTNEDDILGEDGAIPLDFIVVDNGKIYRPYWGFRGQPFFSRLFNISMMMH